MMNKLSPTPLDAAGSGELIYDRDDAIDRLGGDTALFAEVARLFIAERPNYCRELESALARADAVALRLQAHTMKSLLATFSCEAGRVLAQRLEDVAAAGDLAAAAALTGQVSAAASRLAAALDLAETGV